MRTLRWAGWLALLVVAGGLVGCGMLDPVPVANFSWNTSNPIAGEEVQFNDNSTDAGGAFTAAGIDTRSWDFGDDSTSTSQNPKHAYAKGSTYEVTLTVTDKSGGKSSVTKEISVAPSIGGHWTGTITSLIYNTFSLSFDLTQLPGGTVTGTITVSPYFPQGITSGSFNAATREVQLTSEGYGMIFRGQLDLSQTRMSGYWYDDDTNQRGEDWQVNR
ncbi:MAG: PKD domain-containing protein [Candidatus Bipolaricaulota bacterium]|nr:PKD domain-containing protein [Candidatus Bipolaricaulota bacterium]